MSKADVKRLLRKGKLSGKQAALLAIRDLWEEISTGKGFLSDTETIAIRDSIRPGQLTIFNEYLEFFQAAWYGVIDAGRLGLSIAVQCGKLYPLISSYGAEARRRWTMIRLPRIVTAKEYEERRLAQREEKLLEPVSLGFVLNWYASIDILGSEQLIQLWDAYREDNPDTLHDGPFSYALHEIDDIELATPWLGRLLEMLKDGRLEPVQYTEEAAERASSYLETSADYASVYQEQSKRSGARETATLIEAIENYLAGSLSPAELDSMLWNWHVTGLELYEAGWAKVREYIDNYQPRLPECPFLAILQDEHAIEGFLLVDQDTGRYESEQIDKELQQITLYDSYRKVYAEVHEGGLEGYLTERREHLIRRLEELIAFQLGLQAASRVLGIELTKEPWDEIEQGFEGIRHLNEHISLARLHETEPLLPIEQIDISSLKPSERVIGLMQSRLGKLLPAGWAEENIESGPEPEDEEEAHEPA